MLLLLALACTGDTDPNSPIRRPWGRRRRGPFPATRTYAGLRESNTPKRVRTDSQRQSWKL